MSALHYCCDMAFPINPHWTTSTRRLNSNNKSSNPHQKTIRETHSICLIWQRLYVFGSSTPNPPTTAIPRWKRTSDQPSLFRLLHDNVYSQPEKRQISSLTKNRKERADC